MPVLSGQAPAKVNLALNVLDRRADGYHELRTIFQTISLADRLRVSYTNRGAAKTILHCTDPSLAGPGNLAARAAGDLLQAGGWRGGVEVTIEKRIPVGAGLGGGSSDAAAVLRALALLLKPAPPADMLFEVAASLGSDVPYFLVGGSAVGIGRGEEVYPLPEGPAQWLVLLVPDVRVSTAEAYRELGRRKRRLTAARLRHIINGFCSGVSVSRGCGTQTLPEARLSCFHNDFEEVVFRRYPKLEPWKNVLLQRGASCAMMSGSGSALFGVFPDRRQALRARAAIDAFPGKVYLARTLNRRSYRGLWRLQPHRRKK